MNFYKDNVFIQNQPEQASTNSVKTSVRYTGINKFIVTFNRNISGITITPSSFSLSFSEAFGNYMLTNMLKYNKDNKYIVYFKILDNYSIEFRIEYDLLNTVPVNLKYMILEDV